LSSSRRRIFTAVPLAAGLLVLLFLMLRYSGYPDWESFLTSPFSPVITDRYGEELRVLPLGDGLRRIYTPLEDYPDYLPAVFLAGEDKRFYRHAGIDPLAIIRAANQNRKSGRIVSGASTVSMQLAGLAHREPASVVSKLREMAGALRIEARHSKDELLELWLSSLPFGSNLQGAAAAGRHFFGVLPENLSPEQSLLLAVIPRRPELYNPLKNPDAASAAAFMLSKNAGIQTTREALLSAALQAIPGGQHWPYNAPHFVNWVEEQLTPEDYRPGPPVRTTLDLRVNDILSGAVISRIERAQRFRISNGSGLVIEPQTGEILAYVGSSDFFNFENSGQIDGVRILRQPGSTLKPFLYSLALESGYSASSILPDIPMTFGNEEIYVPQNYNQRYNGPVRLRTALSSSLNIPAVYLTEKMGVDNFVELLLSLGFDSLKAQREQLGVGLALGNAEISLFELVRAYAVFPRGGRTVVTSWRKDIRNSEMPQERPIMDETTAGLIRSILSDNVNRILGFGRQGLGTEGFDAMMKTGTSNQFNNIWAVGATPAYVCGIWMGNFSGETVIGSPGSGIPADAVVDVMTRLQQGERFSPVYGLREVLICPLSGGAVTEACPSSMTELFRSGEEPEACSFHSLNAGEMEINYPPEYRTWADIYGVSFQSQNIDYRLKILSPADGSIFFFDSTLPYNAQAVPIEIDGQGLCRLSVNGREVFSGDLPLRWFLPMRPGYYTLRAEVETVSREILVELR